MKLTKKVFSLFICLILSSAFFSFSFTNRVQATNKIKWDNITPKSPPLTITDGSADYNSGYNYAWAGYQLHLMTSFADLVETKPDGSKVIHYFQFIPSSSYGDGYYMQYGRTYYYQKGAVVHWDSETEVWEKINPSFFGDYWAAYSGGFTVVESPYIDADGSIWNGRLLLHTTRDFHQTYYYYGAYDSEGHLYARTYRPDYVGRYYPGKTCVLRWDGADNWTDMWDQSGDNGHVVPGPNNAGSYQDAKGTSSGKTYITYYDGSVYIAAFKDRYCHTYNDPSCSYYYSSPYWDLKIYQYTGSLDALLNSPAPPQAWTEVWSYPYGSRSYSYGPPSIYEFKVLNDRFFLSTSTEKYNDYAYQSMSNGGYYYVSQDNTPSTLTRGTLKTPPPARIGTIGDLPLTGGWEFPLEYNGTTYTAVFTSSTPFYYCYSYSPTQSYAYNGSYYNFYVNASSYDPNHTYRVNKRAYSNSTCKFKGTISGSRIYLSAIAYLNNTNYDIESIIPANYGSSTRTQLNDANFGTCGEIPITGGYSFPITYGGTTYTAQWNTSTKFFYCYGYNNTRTYAYENTFYRTYVFNRNLSSYDPNYTYMNYRRGLTNQTIAWKGTISGTTINLTHVGWPRNTKYCDDVTLQRMEVPFEVGSPPSTFEFFKGYVYSGFYNNSSLVRTNDFSFANLSNMNTWNDCGTINDPGASPSRPMTGAILALQKTTGKDEYGDTVDTKMFIASSYMHGGESPYAYQYYGTVPLYSTEGEDVGGDPDTVPLKFTLEEDEWREDKSFPSPNFQNSIYGVYDLYDSSMGLIAQFSIYKLPNQRYYYHRDSEHHFRKFMVYNAPPSCDITQDPDPYVNERGTFTSGVITFVPTGGFGAGDVKIWMDLPENIYVPNQDSGGSPINQQFLSPRIPMDGLALSIPLTIKSTGSAVADMYTSDPQCAIHILDFTTGIEVVEYFHLNVIPPKPGFSVDASPTTFTLFQGECPSTECCEDHCKQIDLDLFARNGFEDNVLIGTYWTDPPANHPEGASVEWVRNTFVYDVYDTVGTSFSSLAEVRVRPDMGTRYSIKVRVSPDTLPGVYKFCIMFLSGSIKRQVFCTMKVLPPRPAIDVNPADGIGNFSMQVYTKEVIPGGSVNYRLKIESKAGFSGKVTLSLRNLPDQVYIDNYSGYEGIEAEVPVPGYNLNIVEISPTLDAFANVRLQTTPYTINPYPPTNLAVNSVNQNLNIISWDASRRGSRPIGGYEVWRSLTRYIDAANRIAIVNSPNTSYEDADVEPNTPYYYFVRAFDNDTPANFSTYATSGRVGEAASVTIVDDELDQVMATADKMGTIPGFYTLQVIGNGVGVGPGNVPTNPSAVTYLGLHVYRQDLNLKTPFLDVWGALALLFGMMLVAWQFVFRKKEEQTF